jgi:hypothetical protein
MTFCSAMTNQYAGFSAWDENYWNYSRSGGIGSFGINSSRLWTLTQNTTTGAVSNTTTKLLWLESIKKINFNGLIFAHSIAASANVSFFFKNSTQNQTLYTCQSIAGRDCNLTNLTIEWINTTFFNLSNGSTVLKSKFDASTLSGENLNFGFSAFVSATSGGFVSVNLSSVEVTTRQMDENLASVYEGLISEWDLDTFTADATYVNQTNNSAIYSDPGILNNFTKQQNVTIPSGRGLNFSPNSSNYIEVPVATFNYTGKEFAWESYFQYYNTIISDHHTGIYSEFHGATPGANLFIYTNDRICWGNYDPGIGYGLCSPVDKTANTWYHVIVSQDKDNLTLYINGEKANQTSKQATHYGPLPNYAWIGSYWQDGHPFYFNGTIDYLKIYNRSIPQWMATLKFQQLQNYNMILGQVELIDETTGNAFNISNVSSAIIYYNNESLYYDLKANSKTQFNFSAYPEDRMRIYLKYADGREVNRYIDTIIVGSGLLRICAAKDNNILYEQIAYSSTGKQVILKNIFANCYSAADDTRFAYQQTNALKAQTIDASYNLFLLTDGQLSLLAGVDGGMTNSYNLDAIEFDKQGYDTSIYEEALTFQTLAALKLMKIYYKDLQNRSSEMYINITRTDTGAVVAQVSNLTSPNEWTLYFNYSLLTGYDNTTLFKINLQKVGNSTINQITKYFNIGGGVGQISNGLAIAVSIILVMFGLTITIPRATFSWFGILIMILAMFILSYAVGGVWYVTFLFAIEIIITLFMVILLALAYYPEVMT